MCLPLIRSLGALLLATLMALAVPAHAQGPVTEGQGCPSLAPVERWGKQANPADYMDSNSVFCGDFTGDGKPDAFAVVRFAMGGNNYGQDAVLFENVGGTLRVLRAVPEFFGQPDRATFSTGKVILDMTVMRPNDPRCCPSGKERREVDVATGRHRIATAAPAAASRPVAPRPATPRPAPSSPPAVLPAPRPEVAVRLPMRPGFYGEAPASCAAAARNLSGVLVTPGGFEFPKARVTVAVVTADAGRRGSFTLIERTIDDNGRPRDYASKIRVIDADGFIRLYLNPVNPRAAPVSNSYRFCSPNAPAGWK